MGGISSERVIPIGLPQFSDSSAMNSSARASMASAIRKRASERSFGVESRHPSNAAAAAFIAVSTSVADDSGAVAYCSPVAGFTTPSVRPSAASTYLPSMKFR